MFPSRKCQFTWRTTWFVTKNQLESVWEAFKKCLAGDWMTHLSIKLLAKHGRRNEKHIFCIQKKKLSMLFLALQYIFSGLMLIADSARASMSTYLGASTVVLNEQMPESHHTYWNTPVAASSSSQDAEWSESLVSRTWTHVSQYGFYSELMIHNSHMISCKVKYI